MAITAEEFAKKTTILPEEFLAAKPSGIGREESFKELFPVYEPPERGRATPEFLLTPKKIRENLAGAERDVADLGGKPDDYYASMGNSKFFSEQFHITPENALKQEQLIGRALYNNSNLSSYQINNLIEKDVADGYFDTRARMAKWTQYGVPEDMASEIDELYHSDWADNIRFNLEIPVGGLAKALFGTFAGAGDLVHINTPFSDNVLKNINESQNEFLNDALVRGDYGDYVAGMLGKTAGDVGGNLWLMNSAIKAANVYSGGKMTLAAKGKTWKALATNTAKRSAFLAGLNFVRTEGSLSDKGKSFAITMAYMNTPIISSMSPTHLGAFFNDFLLNSGITIGTGQYKDAWEEAGEMANSMERPEDRKKIFIGMAIPLLGSDVAFSALTRSIKQTNQTALLRSYVESSRVLTQKGAVELGGFERALGEKYGEGWQDSMSDADSVRYQAIKTANDAVKSGGITEEALQPKAQPSQARIAIENDKVYYRDAEGNLRDVEGKDIAPEKPVEVKKVKLDTEPILDEKAALEARKAAEKAQKKEEAKRNSLISKILRPIADATSYNQKKALTEIQQSILKPKNDKAQSELDRVASYLQDNPDAKLPPKLMKDLAKTSINKLSTDNLKTVADEVDRLRKQGRTKFKLEHKQRKAQNAADAATIKNTMKAPKPEKVVDVSGKPKKKISLKFQAMRPDRFADMLDGAKGKFSGLAHKIFIDNAREGRAQQNEMKDARLAGGERLVADLGMKVRDFNKKTTILVNGKPAKMTNEQLMGAYAGSKNRLNRAAILHGNFKGDEAAMQKAIDIVENDVRLKTIADYILYDFANNTGRVFDSVGKNEGVVLNGEEYYIPMRRDGIEQKTSLDDMHDNVLGRQKLIKQMPDDKFTFGRKEIPEEFQNAIDLNLLSLWEREVGLQEHYIAQMGNVKQMRGVVEANGFRGDLKKSYGENATEWMDKYIDTVANPMSIYQHDAFAKVSRRMRKNIATAYLAGNVKTMIKQFPSIMLYSGEASPARLASSLAEITAGFEERDGRLRNDILDFVAEKDPLVKHSHMQRELDELRLSDRNKYDRIMNQVGEVGFRGILEVDRLARSAGWYAVYKKAIEGGKSDDEAVRLARNATARTQPTAAAEELPQIYRTNEALNWMLMFSNQLNQIWNMSTKDVPRRILRGDNKEKIAGIAEAGGLAMTALMIWSVNNGRIPETPEELKDAMSDQALASVPLVGSHLVNGMHGYDSAMPVVEFSNKTGKMIAKLSDGEEVPAEDYFDFAFENIAPLGGIPVVAIKRGREAIEEQDPLKLTGIKKKKDKKTGARPKIGR
tara:strand:+ start:1514 stop:5446 length:3933 start_codon:yes stop_codon:yes gene_type:complete